MIRLLIAAAVSLVVSLLGTRFLIKWLVDHRIGQHIRSDGPASHQTKAGTPTMGGLAIVGGATAGYVISNLYRGVYTRTGLVVMVSIIGAGAVGLFDDWLKFKRARNLGLTKRTKLAGQLLVAAFFVLSMIHWAGADTVLAFTRSSNSIELGPWLWALMAVLWILGSTNGVNLTDGLDGLAAGSSALGFAAYVIIAFWQLRHLDLYNNTHALDLAVVAASMLGGCVGFLWWNAAPAQIFMGDAGALALGGAFATLSITTNTHLLLPIIGFLFVLETSSVILQVISFRVTKGRKRIFRMAPLHHHFELGGWPETTVIIRLWIISGMFTAIGLGFYYFDFLSTGLVD